MARSKLRRRIPFILAGFWLIVLTWAMHSMQATGFDLNMLESNESVSVVETGESIHFSPAVDTMNVGLIFYPGALVQAEAYVPLARAVAEAGYTVSIVKQPFRIGWIGPNWRKVVARTQKVIDLGPPERQWIIGGHSRGGQLATRLVREHPGLAASLLLIGTSHPREDDMSDLQIDVTKVFGSEDGLASEEEVKQFAKNLPPDTHFVRIAGANHSQFGWYGWQFMAGTATISRQAQYDQTVVAVLDQLGRLQAQ